MMVRVEADGCRRTIGAGKDHGHVAWWRMQHDRVGRCGCAGIANVIIVGIVAYQPAAGVILRAIDAANASGVLFAEQDSRIALDGLASSAI